MAGREQCRSTDPSSLWLGANPKHDVWTHLAKAQNPAAAGEAYTAATDCPVGTMQGCGARDLIIDTHNYFKLSDGSVLSVEDTGCNDECATSNNGVCEDGGFGSCARTGASGRGVR